MTEYLCPFRQSPCTNLCRFYDKDIVQNCWILRFMQREDRMTDKIMATILKEKPK